MSDPFAAWRQRIEIALATALPSGPDPPQRLHAAMRYAVLGGGKRLRPLLVYASGQACGTSESTLDPPAVAVELVHAFSLVHDDLPVMDNDDLRRGRPTVHVAFDEATALLAGDALQTLAFEVLASAPLAAGIRVAMLASLAQASGAHGMCGGQALDMAATGLSLTLPELERLHSLKTGALIRAAVRMGALASQTDHATMARLDEYAAALGLAFQIRDDLLDVESDTSRLGKTAGKDQAQAKATYPSLIGPKASRQRLHELAAQMQSALAPLGGKAAMLQALADLAINRDH